MWLFNLRKMDDMMNKKKFDSAPAHEYFLKICFNGVWDLIEKTTRSPSENKEMIHMSHASMYHWSKRPDGTDQNLSVGCWQLSRVYTLVGEADNAIKYGRLCLDHSKKDGVAVVFLGYAYEALARAYALAGDGEKKEAFMKKAIQIAEGLSSDDKAQLQGDLETIK